MLLQPTSCVWTCTNEKGSTNGRSLVAGGDLCLRLSHICKRRRWCGLKWARRNGAAAAITTFAGQFISCPSPHTHLSARVLSEEALRYCPEWGSHDMSGHQTQFFLEEVSEWAETRLGRINTEQNGDLHIEANLEQSWCFSSCCCAWRKLSLTIPF